MKLKRIIIHWTAGTHKANAVDRAAYHLLIEGDGSIVLGDLKPEANESVKDGEYAAHTRALNTGSIGVALCAMRGAQERPFSKGRYPITTAQVDALIGLVADLCITYNIPVTRETVLTHAEVQSTLGVWQRNKWDIMWLPGYPEPVDPHVIGDKLRTKINLAKHLQTGASRPNKVKDVVTDGEVGTSITGIAALITALGTSLSDLDPNVQYVALGVAGLALILLFGKRIRNLI